MTKRSQRLGKLIFNGFCFGVNISGIQKAAADYPQLLFNPSDIMVGQEDRLVEAMRKHDLVPKISLLSFFYHFKSYTVRAATASKYMSINNISLSEFYPAQRNPGGYFLIKANNSNLHSSSKDSSASRIDIREDIRLYHPELIATQERTDYFSSDSMTNHGNFKMSGRKSSLDQPTGIVQRKLSESYPSLYRKYNDLSKYLEPISLTVYPSTKEEVNIFNSSQVLRKHPHALRSVLSRISFEARLIVAFATSG
jgi:hypothetical protein